MNHSTSSLSTAESTLAVEPPSAERLLRQKQQHIWPCVYHFYRRPPVIVRGQGACLYDASGRRLLDLYSGVGVMNAGHSNPQIVAAATEQLARLQHTTTIYLSEPMLALAERLAAVLPEGLTQSFFCASGTEANEAALLLAVLHTGRHEFVVFDRGLHGRTKAAMSATSLDMWRTDPFPLPEFHRMPPPETDGCLQAVEALLRRETVAACLIEPVQGNGGIHPAPEGFLPQLQQLCHRYGTLLVLDEVQTGFGRTGRWFASQRFGVVPDVITVAKALGNGLPIAAAATRPELADSYRRPGASTFGGNPISAAAALAVLDYHQQHNLAERADSLGGRLRSLLEHRLAGHPLVRDIRGVGLMLGVELALLDEPPSETPFADLLEDLKDDGYLVGRTGAQRNVLTIMPPLVIEWNDLEAFVDVLTHRLDERLSAAELLPRTA